VNVHLDPHPELEVALCTCHFHAPLGTWSSPPSLLALFALDAPAPLTSDEPVRQAIRQLLKVGGFKPSGRSKPASEYLRNAVASGALGPSQSINLAVDTCNAVSFHSGLPMSVIDPDRGSPPWRIALAPAGASYVFNSSGQVIDIGGLVSLWDKDGPCAGPVKDAQRTKTHGGTVRTLSVVWGTTRLAGRAAEAMAWYREVLEGMGATTSFVAATALEGEVTSPAR
jgi:DNA/RNA-binding domain of Phe-tRNA-synthetase-like protein